MITHSPVLSSSASFPYATVKAYRVSGGAIVTVTRGDRSRRYRVSNYRFRWLRSVFSLCQGGNGFYGNTQFHCTVVGSIGEAVQWMRSQRIKV